MLNKCEFIGRMVKDAELKTSSGGKSYCAFTVVATDGFGKYEDVQYINCISWNKIAENIAKFCKKGDLVYVAAKYQNNSREKNEKGYNIPNPQFEVREIKFLNTRNSNNSEASADTAYTATTTSTDDFVAVADISGDDLPF